MVEKIETKPAGMDYTGQGVRGPIWALFGTAAAAGGVYLLNTLLNGFGNGRCVPPPPASPVATQRDLTYERELTQANAKIAQLEAQQFSSDGILAAERRFEDKLDKIEAEICAQKVHNAVNDGAVAGIAAQTAQLQKLTAPYIVQPVMAASEGALNFVPSALAAASAAGKAAGGGTTTP